MNYLIEIKEGLAIAWDAILANKLRSVLTTLGIIIGIVTVTSMATAIDALNRAFHDSLSILGADVLFVSQHNWVNNTIEEWISDNKRPYITREQARQVERQMIEATAVAPAVSTTQAVWYQNHRASSVEIIGSTDQFLTTSGFNIALGRFLSSAEDEGGRPVCVIGNDVATNLFPKESPIGKKIIIGARRLEVIGVLEKRGSFLGLNSFDNEVIIPIQQLLIGYMRNPNFEVQVKVRNVKHLDDAKEELRGLMRKIRHVAPGDPDNFSINQQEQILKTLDRVTGTLATVGLLVTSMSLFVGGIGIMNIMFVSVAERTREIGVRKAIGAKRRTILLQFLIEAASICLIGGLAGLCITYLLTLSIKGAFPYFPVTMSMPVMALAIVTSIVTGVVSGFAPAWRAARMNPVDALRSE
ncbi:MAG TPA: ABC transporter permease [Candidatus Baltobacteraceae bacterium]|nr:ABC transporter permease [Candidatus Baltobacteraceae bacterium]